MLDEKFPAAFPVSFTILDNAQQTAPGCTSHFDAASFKLNLMRITVPHYGWAPR